MQLATDLRTDLVVVGPEAPLVAGLADELRHRGLAVYGPGREAALLEGSTAIAKEVIDAAGVPNAARLPLARVRASRPREAGLCGHPRFLACPAVGLGASAAGDQPVPVFTELEAVSSASRRNPSVYKQSPVAVIGPGWPVCRRSP